MSIPIANIIEQPIAENKDIFIVIENENIEIDEEKNENESEGYCDNYLMMCISIAIMITSMSLVIYLFAVLS